MCWSEFVNYVSPDIENLAIAQKLHKTLQQLTLWLEVKRTTSGKCSIQSALSNSSF